MRNPNPVTFLFELKCADTAGLEQLLRDEIDPKPDGKFGILDFCKHPNLHCMSLFVVPQQAGDTGASALPAYLAIEATVDGPMSDFVRDLVYHNEASLMQILKFCKGFPCAGSENPVLLENFLIQNNRAANAFFSCAPGRSVEEIKLEKKLRDFLAGKLQKTERNDNVFGGETLRVMDFLRRKVLNEEVLRPALATPQYVWSLAAAKRERLLWGALASALTVFFGFVVLYIAAKLFGGDVKAFWHNILLANCTCEGLTTSVINAETHPCTDIWPYARFSLVGIVIIIVLLVVQEFVTKERKQIHHSPHLSLASLTMGTLVFLTRILIAYWATFFLILCALWFGKWIEAGQFAQYIPSFGFWVDAVLKLLLFVILLGITMLVFPAAIYLFSILYLPTETPGDLGWRGVILRSVIRVLRVLVPMLIILPIGAMGYILFSGFLGSPALGVLFLIPYVTAGLFTGVLSVYVLTILFLVGHQIFLWWQTRHTADPSLLSQRRQNRQHVWAREEHGYNSKQNHYVSITLVKRGCLRRILLWLILVAVNFVARTRDIHGELGGIPTIISARWILIDNGQRLVFMTNYVGGWNSYIDEFSELFGVAGVNAIWSNTNVIVDPEENLPKINGSSDVRTRVHFPKSWWLTEGGAVQTQDFKAFVRQSQVETQAWYGAYRDLSIVNIQANGRLRLALLGNADEVDVDDVLKSL